METLQFIGAAIAFFAVGTLIILYENFRIKAGRPILNGSAAVQLYYVSYLTMFVLCVAENLWLGRRQRRDVSAARGGKIWVIRDF
jgi:hypothetical protein